MVLARLFMEAGRFMRALSTLEGETAWASSPYPAASHTVNNRFSKVFSFRVIFLIQRANFWTESRTDEES